MSAIFYVLNCRLVKDVGHFLCSQPSISQRCWPFFMFSTVDQSKMSAIFYVLICRLVKDVGHFLCSQLSINKRCRPFFMFATVDQSKMSPIFDVLTSITSAPRSPRSCFNELQIKNVTMWLVFDYSSDLLYWVDTFVRSRTGELLNTCTLNSLKNSFKNSPLTHL